MKLYEYQAKAVFKKYGIPVPDGEMAGTVAEAVKIASKFEGKVVIKAQVHMGGRGKAGGVKLALGAEETKNIAGSIIGMDLKGLKVEKVLVEKAIDIDKEYYISFAIDRAKHMAVFISSTMGGIDIEDVAKKSPEAINKSYIDSFTGLKDFHLRAFLKQAGLEKEACAEASKIIKSLYKIFLETDANLVEINPLVITKRNTVIAADAKMDIDDNAIYRQPEIYSMVKDEVENQLEYQAKLKGLSYIKMEGNIACIVNGAGLSMATMDIIKLYGGEPANFLDIGGSSNSEKVKYAMNLLLRDKNVKVAFFNIFGGITRCDDVARGLVAAIAELNVTIPIVVRLTGTNAEEGREILKGSGLLFEETMIGAAKKAVGLVA
ncbi:MAG: ADP-forming succinate--CoA ligase subunit beta [bacterium]